MRFLHTISHALPVSEAKQLIDRAFAHYAARYPTYKPRLIWENGREDRGEVRMHARAIDVSAKVALLPTEVTIEIDVPFFLRMFQESARRVIDREAKIWLHHQTP